MKSTALENKGIVNYLQGVVGNNGQRSHFHKAELGTNQRAFLLHDQGSNVCLVGFQNCNTAVTVHASHVAL